jgi:flagellar hook-associated protein 2
MATTGSISLSTQSPIYSTVSALMVAVNKPIQAQQAKVTSLQSLNTVYSSVKNDLSALQSAAAAMTNAATQPLSARAVSSSDSSIVTATATASAALGSHSISVSQLAKQDTLVSNQYANSGTDIVDAEGAGDKSFTITVNGQSKDVFVTLTAGETNSAVISAVMAAINSAFTGVGSANAVTATALADTSTTSKLILASDQTGATYKMTLADDTNGGSLLATLGIGNASAATDTTGGYIYAESALNARMTVDGVGVTRDSNIVTDVLPGITLNLNGQHSLGANPVSLVVSADANSIGSTVQNFLTSYNAALSYVNSQSAINTATGAYSALSGEPMYRNLIGTLRATVGASVSGTGSSQMQTLADIGITQASDGTLSISNSQTFNQALASNPTAVAALFNSTNGIANRINAVLTPFTKNKGIMDSETAGANARIAALNATIKRMNAAAAVKQTYLINEYSQLQALQSITSNQQKYMQIILGMLGSNTSGVAAG